MDSKFCVPTTNRNWVGDLMSRFFKNIEFVFCCVKRLILIQISFWISMYYVWIILIHIIVDGGALTKYFAIFKLTIFHDIMGTKLKF